MNKVLAGVAIFLAMAGVGALLPEHKTADCNGTNGNAAVAACHPDNQAIQDACPDNSNGEKYAAPDDTCLDAVSSSFDSGDYR